MIHRNGGERGEPLTLPVGGNGRLYGLTSVGEYCPRSKTLAYCTGHTKIACICSFSDFSGIVALPGEFFIVFVTYFVSIFFKYTNSFSFIACSRE